MNKSGSLSIVLFKFPADMGTAVKHSSMTSHHQAWFVSSYICSKLTRYGKLWKQIYLNPFFLPKKSKEDFPLNHKHSIFNIHATYVHMRINVRGISA